jgi:CRP-like cAMP-binding protein
VMLSASFAHLRRRKLVEKDDGSLQNSRKHIFLKGEIIPLKPQVIWQVCQGLVKLTTMSENGEEVLVGLAGPALPFGCDLTSLHTYQAIALTDVELICFSLTDIVTSPSFAQSILPQIKQRLRQTESLLAIAGQRRVKDRLLQLLQLLKQEIGQSVDKGTRLNVRFTHQDLADACSTTRVTITRVLGKLQQQGTIIIDSKSHIIIKE